MRKLPPLNALRAFEAAARHVSLTKAAQELHVTHGAVSRQVASLEAWLGTPMFTRSASQLRLTDAGRRYLEEVTPALDRIAVASTHLLEQAAPTALRVSAPPTFAMRWLIPRMSGFQRRRPGVEIKLTTSIAPVNFREHGYDIAIRGSDAPVAGCRSVPFMTEIIVPICHVDLLEHGRLTRPEDLAAHTLITYATEPIRWSDWLKAAGVAELRPASVLKLEQMYFALQAAAEGLGVVLVPLFLVADDIIAGRLFAPFGTLAARQRVYFANAAGSGDPVIESFCDWLVGEGRDTERAIDSWAQAMGWKAG
jgi:LysR family glycine cleavage system transcriptional activator